MNKNIFPAILLALLTGPVVAETRYVTDELEVTLRSGQSTRNAIVRMLRSGTAVEVMEESAETGYARVRTANGAEGWVLSRFLVTTPAARDRLPSLQQEVAGLREQLRATREQLEAAQSENRELTSERNRLRGDYERTAEGLESLRTKAASVLEIDQQNETLKSRVRTLEQERQALTEQNKDLSGRRTMEWFVIGASVLFVGVLLGLILPRLRLRRRSGWGDL
jgi:SH3 domain protein